jgi:RNA polymerase sigma factor (sigma-70 family)
MCEVADGWNDEQVIDLINAALAEASCASVTEGERQRLQGRARRMQDMLFERLLPLSQSVIRRFTLYLRRAGLEPEEMLGEAYIHFVRALPSFECSRGSKLRDWYRRVLSNRLIQLGRRGRRREREGPAQEVQLSLLAFQRQELQVEVRDLLGQLLRHDRDRDRKVRLFAEHHLAGRSLQELAREVGASITTVHRWVEQARESARALLRAAAANRAG